MKADDHARISGGQSAAGDRGPLLSGYQLAREVGGVGVGRLGSRFLWRGDRTRAHRIRTQSPCTIRLREEAELASWTQLAAVAYAAVGLQAVLERDGLAHHLACWTRRAAGSRSDDRRSTRAHCVSGAGDRPGWCVVEPAGGRVGDPHNPSSSARFPGLGSDPTSTPSSVASPTSVELARANPASPPGR